MICKEKYKGISWLILIITAMFGALSIVTIKPYNIFFMVLTIISSYFAGVLMGYSFERGENNEK